MSLAQITDKIKNDAQREADEILAKAKAQAEAVTKKTKEENDAVKASFDKRFEAEKPEIFKRREIVANLDVKKMMLQSGRDLIQDVYTTALDKMSKLGKDEYLSLAESLLKQAVETKEEILLLSADEKFINQAWIDAFNKNNNAQLTISEEKADIVGGFILVKGKIRTNCSWDMLIQVAQEKNEGAVIERLFKSAE